MKITTCYTVPIKNQLEFSEDGEVSLRKAVDDKLMKACASLCLEALKFCVEVFLREWNYLSSFKVTPKKGVVSRKRVADMLVHSGRECVAKYPEFDRRFPYMPAYTRRAIVADALGMVSSYKSNHKNWEAQNVAERGAEPTLGLPDRYELTFYEQERDVCSLDKGIIGLKLFDGSRWMWFCFSVSPSDAKYISAMKKHRKMLSPVVEKVRGRYQIRFSFEEDRQLVQDENPLAYIILAVDLGINAPASWSVMSSDGTVHAKGVIHLRCEEDRLNHLINRKRMYQQAGKKPKAIYRLVKNANRRLSIGTCRELMLVAVKYNVDCIVFEHLDRKGRIKGKRYRERIHLWRANDVQERMELQTHRFGMRISRVCAWGTSKLAFDGSGEVLRGDDAGLPSYSVCRFQNGKIYNCDLSASQNIGARYFLRCLQKLKECPELPKVPQRTLATLRETVRKMAA